MKKLVMIGGGENGHHNTQYETAPFDKEIIALTGKAAPNFLFIGLANKYPDYYYEVMRGIYGDMYGCRTAHLTREDIENTGVAAQKINAADILYVGGGNTLKMMQLLRKYGIDRLLIEASEKGKVLCGVSAGAICWCTYGESDSRQNTSTRVRGLGIVPVLFSPHIVTQPQRMEYLKKMMKTTYKLPAIALDRAALELVGDQYRVLYLEENSKAVKCYWKQGRYYEEDIKSSKWKSTDTLYTQTQHNQSR